MLSRPACFLILFFLPAATAFAQATAPSSGDVTVRLSQPLDSATGRPNQVAPGVVMNSSDPSIPKGASAGVLLVSDPSGGFSVHLARLLINGQIMRTASEPGVLSGVSKLGGFLHDAGTPKTAASGPRVYLPPNTDLRFSLTAAPPPPPQASAPARVMSRPAPPPPPSHPANTARDIPAAAPGYPPMRATHDAELDCWWTPYLSQKWGFEAPIEKCAHPENSIAIIETKTGLALSFGSNPSTGSDFLTVESKPADQPIELAIRAQFIMKLKVPAARTSCKVQKQDSVAAAEIYAVIATGPYSKLKKFQGDEDGEGAESPCTGLGTDDVYARFFMYLPNESKTHFYFVDEDDNGGAFDHAAIRFPSRDQ